MGRKKKDEPERTCATCDHGPERDACVNQDDCENGDLWYPKPPVCDGDSCKVSVNGGPAVPFPSKEATEQVTGMIKEHLVPHGSVVSERTFGDGHVLTEYADGKVSLDGSEPVTKEAMKATVDAVQAIKGEKAQKQLDLEGKPLPEPEVQEDESTEIKTYALYYSNGLKFRMGEEALDKALELKKTENVSDRKDRIRLLVQNRAKVLNSSKPLDPITGTPGPRRYTSGSWSGTGENLRAGATRSVTLSFRRLVPVPGPGPTAASCRPDSAPAGPSLAPTHIRTAYTT